MCLIFFLLAPFSSSWYAKYKCIRALPFLLSLQAWPPAQVHQETCHPLVPILIKLIAIHQVSYWLPWGTFHSNLSTTGSARRSKSYTLLCYEALCSIFLTVVREEAFKWTDCRWYMHIGLGCEQLLCILWPHLCFMEHDTGFTSSHINFCHALWIWSWRGLVSWYQLIRFGLPGNCYASRPPLFWEMELFCYWWMQLVCHCSKSVVSGVGT
jgi:hypothetical protein